MLFRIEDCKEYDLTGGRKAILHKASDYQIEYDGTDRDGAIAGLKLIVERPERLERMRKEAEVSGIPFPDDLAKLTA